LSIIFRRMIWSLNHSLTRREESVSLAPNCGFQSHIIFFCRYSCPIDGYLFFFLFLHSD
jgi:hypothetical protein